MNDPSAVLPLAIGDYIIGKAMTKHTHQWQTKVDSARRGYGLACDCGEWLPYESVASYLNRLEDLLNDLSVGNIVNAQHKAWCVRDSSDTWHLVTGITGAMADPYVARTACGRLQGVAERSWGKLGVPDCERCIETL